MGIEIGVALRLVRRMAGLVKHLPEGFGRMEGGERVGEERLSPVPLLRALELVPRTSKERLHVGAR